MRSIFTSFNLSCLLREVRSVPGRRVVFSAVVALLMLAGPSVWAQSADDDLYGIPGDTGESASSVATDTADTAIARPAVDPVVADTAPVSDTSAAPSASDTSSADTTAAAASDPASVDTVRVASPRPRVTRETTINPLDTDRGGYRNPKKALFMSLLVPGLGQAYVGQNTFTYARAAVYFGTEITLGLLWRHYTVVKYDRQVKRYKAHADDHWSAGRYEDRLFDESPQPVEDFERLNPSRDAYCDAVQASGSQTGENLNNGCKGVYSEDVALLGHYTTYAEAHEDRVASADSASLRADQRAAFASPVEFYALIGSYQEFIAGWDDAAGVAYGDTLIAGSSANRDAYLAMRSKAQEYSRMQAWFIGGIVLNHIASAVDAAITARRNNKRLYGDEAMWFDRLNFDGGLAFDRGSPLTHLTARLSF